MRQRIVAAARTLFLRDGVEAVSMRNLAGEVGCSPMWLYRYFDNKQEILWQVWDLFFRELFDRLERIEATSPRARLEQAALAYLDYWTAHPDRFLIVFLQKDLVPGGTRRYLEASDIVGRFGLFMHLVADAQAGAELGGPDAAEVAQGLVCLLQGLALNFITIPEFPWHDPASLGRLTVQSYLSGLPPSPDRPPPSGD
ncbi:TetR family transcriptional regulator [Zavarzinia compransoris]|nr:TetR family transcriptional regulator [Zavarzinia compransoris]